jgi:hypothetical protein
MSSVGIASIAVLSCVAIGLALCSPTEAAFTGRNGDIAFVGFGPRGDADVFTMKPDGSGRGNITDRPGFDVSPVYSPDGRRIAFTSSRSEPPGFDGNERLFSELPETSTFSRCASMAPTPPNSPSMTERTIRPASHPTAAPSRLSVIATERRCPTHLSFGSSTSSACARTGATRST